MNIPCHHTKGNKTSKEILYSLSNFLAGRTDKQKLKFKRIRI